MEGNEKNQRWKEQTLKIIGKIAAGFTNQIGISGQFLKLFTWLITCCHKALLP